MTLVASDNSIREGLEMQLLVLQDTLDDPMNEDENVCVRCWQLSEDCICARSTRIHWPIKFAIELLNAVVNELANTN